MAARARARRETAEAEQRQLEAEHEARLLAEAGPPVPGEDEHVITEGGHCGHRSHIDGAHPGLVVCQCGKFLGLYSYVLDSSWEWRPCPVCTARGIPQEAPG